MNKRIKKKKAKAINNTKDYQKAVKNPWMMLENMMREIVDECINEGILEDFLKENKDEVIKAAAWELVEEKYMQTLADKE